MGNKPIYKEKAGSMSIAVFENAGKTKDGKDFIYKSVNLQKSYKDKDGEWKNLDLSMRSDDIPRAILVLQKAYENCILNEKTE